MATVYAVASAKGGVGKTTTTAALATVLAESGADVVAIDADLGMANLAGVVGVTPGETTLHDVLTGEADPEDAVREGASGLRVVPGAADLDAYAAADPSGLRRVVEAFGDADFVFVDAGAGLSHDSTMPLAVADETLLVSTPERSALGDTEKTRQLTERLGGTVAGAAITRVTDDADEVVTALLDAPILGRIPDDEAVPRAAAANRPLLAVAPDAPATRAYRDLARALTGTGIDGTGLNEPAADAAGGAGDGGDGDDDGEAEPEATDDEAGEGERADADELEADDERTTDESDGEAASEDGEAASEDDEIIVADPDATGVTEPGDGEDIIVASESEPTDDDTDEDADGGPAADGDETASESAAATAGEGDEDAAESDAAEGDEDAAESDAEESDAEPAPIPDADETARTATGETGSGDDVEDELAGSIPFRDDDTGTMNTVLSDEDREDEGNDGSESSPDADDADRTDPEPSEAADPRSDEEEQEKSGGFFSRLFGR
ncbi:cell division ATPase MinD [Halorubrum sp. SP9]|uniref:cell division ATPase MinD n=1 Tax=Halorubrum sp. SP9 TaxID=1537267 RepID=UPI0010F6BB77|nr:cell division ATPase MinD [Halorubrum sp. SP9]TKX69562.1 cobyrinic acid ac-diamide synthase [Halorubrum sp. SP9]